VWNKKQAVGFVLNVRLKTFFLSTRATNLHPWIRRFELLDACQPFANKFGGNATFFFSISRFDPQTWPKKAIISSCCTKKKQEFVHCM
jgi:hypothetical protein